MKINKAKRVLIIRLSSLGDILLTTPLIRSIKKQNPDVLIDFILREEYSDLLKYNPYISNHFLYKKNSEENKQLIDKISKEKYDVIIDLQNNFRSFEILMKLKGEKLRFNKRTFDKLLLVKFKINRLKKAAPIPVRYAKTLNSFELDDEGLDLFTDKDFSDKIKNEEKVIGFSPGAKHFTKMWPKEYYIELGKKLAENNFQVALFGGRNDHEICKEIEMQIPVSINLCNYDNILQTAADMKKCLAVVCNDSGLMHTACAVKIPVLTFFGSTVKEFGFTPYKNKNLILENNTLSCRPCSHIGRSSCPLNHFKCMLEITPEIAFNNLLQLINS